MCPKNLHEEPTLKTPTCCQKSPWLLIRHTVAQSFKFILEVRLTSLWDMKVGSGGVSALSALLLICLLHLSHPPAPPHITEGTQRSLLRVTEPKHMANSVLASKDCFLSKSTS